jgi:hypothetical protein
VAVAIRDGKIKGRKEALYSFQFRVLRKLLLERTNSEGPIQKHFFIKYFRNKRKS